MIVIFLKFRKVFTNVSQNEEKYHLIGPSSVYPEIKPKKHTETIGNPAAGFKWRMANARSRPSSRAPTWQQTFVRIALDSFRWRFWRKCAIVAP